MKSRFEPPLVLVLTLSVSAGSFLLHAQSLTAETLLELAGGYVTTFAARFSNVVSEERYTQEAVAPKATRSSQSSAPTRAVLRSDFLLARVPGVSEWIPFRDVFEANGLAVRDRENRLQKLFTSGSGSAIERARGITNESARYNIGNMTRTINNPLVAIAFLLPGNQRRFAFTLAKVDRDVSPRAWVLEYHERERPTMIRGFSNADLAANGRLWIDGETGAVLRTELLLEDPAISAVVVTAFQRDGRLGIHVPNEMTEEYRLTGGGRVTGKATYSRFRQFAIQTDEALKTDPFAPR